MKHRHIFIFAIFIAACCQADMETVVPQPRKRLGRDSSELEVGRPGSQSVIGDIQTKEAQYTSALQHCILGEFDLSTRNLEDEPKLRVRYNLNLRVDTKSSEIEIIDIDHDGNLNTRWRALLREAVAKAAAKVTCPKELSERTRYLDLKFEMWKSPK